MKIFEVTVLPDTPPQLQKLQQLAYNLYFSWNEEVMDLYKKMDEKLWDKCERSPIRFLSEVSSETLHSFAEDKQYIKEVNRVFNTFREYMEAKTWYGDSYGTSEEPNMAYFSCEYGLHESIPIYSGGLGVLSGDHIKTASDLGLPLVGVGLLYRSGYFKQNIDQEGVQTETFSPKNLYNLPVNPILNDDGSMRYFSLDIPSGKLWFNVFTLEVGRVTVYLLNSYVPQNDSQMQEITDRLYDSNREKRIIQEYLLGIGGFRVLKELGHEIEMYHLNEGHSAFLLFEYLRILVREQGLSFEEAKLFVQESTCFTTHTPVPAGNERFTIELIEKYFLKISNELGLSWEYFLSLGRENPSNKDEEFCLTILALKLCNRNNGVSKLHGEVSRDMWKSLYPEVPIHEIPIGSITNGVHGETWTDTGLKNMLQSKYREKNSYNHYDKDFFNGIQDIDEEELWKWKKNVKITLIDYTRQHLTDQYLRCYAGHNVIEQAKKVLDPDALTIGFARRFATYKRGNLFLHDKERIFKLLSDVSHPIQFLVAGKAHPADQLGKDVIRSIHTMARELGVQDKIIFLENYNMTIAKYLVTGVDIWLNNPIRPKEASGTSGMKASMNGVLNLSVADGWWVEAFKPSIGWNIDTPVDVTGEDAQNSMDADILYNLLENEIIPTYYEEGYKSSKAPRKWITMMKNSIEAVGGQFNSIRMLKEYTQSYNSTIESTRNLKKDDFKMLKSFSEWKVNAFRDWATLKIVSMSEPRGNKIKREESIEVKVTVNLGKVKSDDIKVECYYGELIGENEIENPLSKEMELYEEELGIASFRTSITPNRGGKLGYTARILPKHSLITNLIGFGLIYWY